MFGSLQNPTLQTTSHSLDITCIVRGYTPFQQNCLLIRGTLNPLQSNFN